MHDVRTSGEYVPAGISILAVPVGTGIHQTPFRLESYSEQVVQPAVDIIVNMIDSDGLALVNEVPQFVGVPGTNPSTNQVYIDAGVQLDNAAVPANDMIRHVMLNPKQSGGILGTQATQFNPNKDVSEQNRTGSMGMAWGSELSPGGSGAQRARPADAARGGCLGAD